MRLYGWAIRLVKGFGFGVYRKPHNRSIYFACWELGLLTSNPEEWEEFK